MELKPYGDRGVLLAALSEAERSAWLVKLEDELPAGCEEYVVGYDSVLLIGQRISGHALAGSKDVASATARQKSSDAMLNASKSSVRSFDVELIYNGADLESVAKACDLTVEQVIDLHTAPTYRVRMMGFSPGFPYLDGLDPRLHLPRRPSPRNHIAPGTVAIGGSHAGIYSVASPGGWHLLGQTEWPLFNREAARHPNPNPKDVFALAPGDEIRFQAKEAR